MRSVAIRGAGLIPQIDGKARPPPRTLPPARRSSTRTTAPTRSRVFAGRAGVSTGRPHRAARIRGQHGANGWPTQRARQNPRKPAAGVPARNSRASLEEAERQSPPRWRRSGALQTCGWPCAGASNMSELARGRAREMAVLRMCAPGHGLFRAWPGSVNWTLRRELESLRRRATLARSRTADSSSGWNARGPAALGLPDAIAFSGVSQPTEPRPAGTERD